MQKFLHKLAMINVQMATKTVVAFIKSRALTEWNKKFRCNLINLNYLRFFLPFYVRPRATLNPLPGSQKPFTIKRYLVSRRSRKVLMDYLWIITFDSPNLQSENNKLFFFFASLKEERRTLRRKKRRVCPLPWVTYFQYNQKTRERGSEREASWNRRSSSEGKSLMCEQIKSLSCSMIS